MLYYSFLIFIFLSLSFTFISLFFFFYCVTQLVLLSAFSVASTATYSHQRPYRSPHLRTLADASNLQINLILLVLLLVRTDTAHTADNEAGNVMYSTDTKFLNELCYGKYETFLLHFLSSITTFKFT